MWHKITWLGEEKLKIWIRENKSLVSKKNHKSLPIENIKANIIKVQVLKNKKVNIINLLPRKICNNYIQN